MRKPFNKRYKKFENNNLPTSFWDEKRQVLEYVYYNSELNYWEKYWRNISLKEHNDFDRKLHVNTNLTQALEDIAGCSFYYPYTSGYFALPTKEDENHDIKIKYGPSHSHSFEEVVRSLYDFPQSFNIKKEDEIYYSEQELIYLRKVQKYLQFIGLKDVDSYEQNSSRFQNPNQSKYGSATIHTYDNETIEDFITGKRNFVVIKPYDIKCYKEYEEYPHHDYREIMRDNDDNIRLFVEYTHSSIQTYKDIKNSYNSLDFNDDDKLVVMYFKIIEIFDKNIN